MQNYWLCTWSGPRQFQLKCKNYPDIKAIHFTRKLEMLPEWKLTGLTVEECTKLARYWPETDQIIYFCNPYILSRVYLHAVIDLAFLNIFFLYWIYLYCTPPFVKTLYYFYSFQALFCIFTVKLVSNQSTKKVPIS
jgi:hypothetical protein